MRTVSLLPTAPPNCNWGVGITSYSWKSTKSTFNWQTLR